MFRCLTSSPARPAGGYAKGEQMRKKVSNVNPNGGRRNSLEPGQDEEPGEHPYRVAPCSHQRPGSADFSKCRSTHVIEVRKNKKEPQPPQRGVSLLKPKTAKHLKSNSYPSTGISNYPSSRCASSSSSSSSSPSHVQTSIITGHDPQGWKLHSKPSCRGARLSLQIPLPVISPHPDSQSDHASDPDHLQKTKTPLGPKTSRRHHSDSSAFLRTRATPLPVVTAGELHALHLRSLALSDASDDVFCRGKEEDVRGTTGPHKIPPPVPEKKALARQIAELIAHSHQRCQTNREHIYFSIMKPRPQHLHSTEDQSSCMEGKLDAVQMPAATGRGPILASKAETRRRHLRLF